MKSWPVSSLTKANKEMAFICTGYNLRKSLPNLEIEKSIA